ncbi:MAG: hypothetical protein O3C60_18140, partial [Planctomycetota bacterium]|nr:hypothetical protein [Planctomycetota bacterium]
PGPYQIDLTRCRSCTVTHAQNSLQSLMAVSQPPLSYSGPAIVTARQHRTPFTSVDAVAGFRSAGLWI